MPRIEQFHPVNVYNRFQEWRATNKARRYFKSWQSEHPIEAEILNLLDLELENRIPEIPRRANISELAKKARRELGFDDQLVPYAHVLPFQVDEFLLRDNVAFSEEGRKLLKGVNHGFWARVGAFTKGLGKLDRLG